MYIELYYIMVVVLAGIGGMYSAAFIAASHEGRGWLAAASAAASSACFGFALVLLNDPPSWVIA